MHILLGGRNQSPKGVQIRHDLLFDATRLCSTCVHAQYQFLQTGHVQGNELGAFEAWCKTAWQSSCLLFAHARMVFNMGRLMPYKPSVKACSS